MYIYNIYLYIFINTFYSSDVPRQSGLESCHNVPNHDNKIKAMVNNKCMLKSMYNDYLSSSFIHNGE